VAEVKMKIYYEDLTEYVTPVEFSASFPEERIELKSFKGNIYKAEKKEGGYYYTLAGDVVFEHSGVCDRCAADTIIKVSGNLTVLAVPGDKPPETEPGPYQLSDEECDWYITHIDYINLYNIFRQETYLMLPAKIACENCVDFVDIVEEFDDDYRPDSGIWETLEEMKFKKEEE
jgi:uncharacterized metal-binding protein YceD (DUF177 family)